MTTIPSSTICEPGAVVLVRFRFTNQSGFKSRPAVILSVEGYHNSRLDAVMVALTTQMTTDYFGDCDLHDWRQAGLPRPTRAKGVIQTIEQRVIGLRLGSLTQSDFDRVKESLREIFGL